MESGKTLKFVLVLFLALGAYALPSGLKAKVAYANGATWQNLEAFMMIPQFVSGLNCSLSNCLLYGKSSSNTQELFFSNSYGKSYFPISSTSLIENISSSSCSGGTCYITATVAGNQSALGFTNGGSLSTFSVGAGNVLNDISCISNLSCVAVGGNSNNALSYYFNNLSTTGLLASALPVNVTNLTKVSCSAANFCLAAGPPAPNSQFAEILYSSNGGASFVDESGNQSVAIPTKVFCVSYGCFVYGFSPLDAYALEFFSALAGFRSLSLPTGVLPQDFYCAQFGCFLTGSSQSTGSLEAFFLPLGSNSFNLVFTASSKSTLINSKINCGTSNALSATSCLLAADYNTGDVLYSTSNGGQSFEYLSNISSNQDQLIACTTASVCVVAQWGLNAMNQMSSTLYYVNISELEIMSSYFLGSNQIAGINRVGCSSLTTCFALGADTKGSNFIDTTVNNWQSFSQAYPFSQNANLLDLSCSSQSTCDLVATSQNQNQSFVSTFNSANNQLVISSTNYLAGNGYKRISCLSTSCVVISSSLASYLNASSGIFNNASLPTDSFKMTSVSCMSSVLCVIAGANAFSSPAIFTSSDSGASFLDASSEPNLSGGELDHISCYQAGCLASGYYVNSGGVIPILWSSSDGLNWSSVNLISGVTGISGLGCSDAGTCYGAFNMGGVSQIYETSNLGNSWIPDQAFNESGKAFDGIYDISCQNNLNCIAIAITGDYQYLISKSAPAPFINSLSPSAGPTSGGQQIIISGSGFTSVTSVIFGSVAASYYEVLSPNLLSVSVPTNSSGFKSVIVVSAFGVSQPNANAGYIYLAPAAYSPINPIRIVDTRSFAGNATGYGGLTLGPGATLGVNLYSSLAKVPVGVQSVAISVTAVGPTEDGFLTVYPGGSSLPDASSLNFSKGVFAVANLVVVPVGINGTINIYNSAGSTNVLVDLEGYFFAQANDKFAPIDERIIDTRNYASNAYAYKDTTLAPGQSISVKISGNFNIPINARAVILNVTATNTSGNGGFISVYPSDLARPSVSSLNYFTPLTVANLVIGNLSPSGYLTFYNGVGSCNLIVDVFGWFSNTNSENFYGISPFRVFDTRSYSENSLQGAFSPFVPGQEQQINFNSLALFGTAPVSLLENVTATQTSATGGYLSLQNTTTSNLNWVAGETVANMAVATLENGYENIFVENSGAQVIVDVYGAFGL